MFSQGNFARGKIGRSATAEAQIENLRLGTMGKLCFAKIVLGAAELPLQIEIGGATPLQTTPRPVVLVQPSSSVCQIFGSYALP